MNRKTFFGKLGGCGICVSAGMLLTGTRLRAEEPQTGAPAEDKAKTKMGHWISDLVGSAQGKEERREIARLLEYCGRACYRREMTSRVPDGKGNLEALLAQFQKMMGPENVQREGKVIHVRYPMKSCVCPVAKAAPVGTEDLFCHCSCGWLQAAFGAVNERIPKVECLESFRRGGKACRFDVTLL